MKLGRMLSEVFSYCLTKLGGIAVACFYSATVGNYGGTGGKLLLLSCTEFDLPKKGWF